MSKRAVGILAAGAVPVAVLVPLVRRPTSGVSVLDERIVRLTVVPRDSALQSVAVVGDVVLHPWVFRITLLAVAGRFAVAGRRREAWWLAATMVAGSSLSGVLKLLVQRPRPDVALVTAGGSSFPSGHALNAALGVTLLLGIAWATLRRRPLAVAAGVLVVAAAALDRLLLGVHHPSDVLAGALLGGAVGAASLTIRPLDSGAP